jgi:prolipoprotein diacylglyceryl transferase
MYVIAFLLAWWLARRRCTAAHSPVNAKEVDDLLFNGMLGVIIGGRVGYCLVYGWDQLISDPLYLFKITEEGGMSFHGGLAGVMIAMWLFGRSRGKTMWQILDFAMCPGALFIAAKGCTRRSFTKRLSKGLSCSRFCGGSRQNRGRIWPCRGCS